jgi:hypothetical protein
MGVLSTGDAPPKMRGYTCTWGATFEYRNIGSVGANRSKAFNAEDAEITEAASKALTVVK